MKVGICVQFRKDLDMAEEFRKAAAEGFDNCQLLSWDPETWTDENAALILRCVEESGVRISGFWCGWEGPKVWNSYEGQETLGLVPPAYREMRVRNLCDGADFAKKIGVTDVITHMGFIPEYPNDPRYKGFCDAVRTVAEHCASNGQWLLFESGQETPTTMLRSFEDIGCPNLGVNLDTANVILYGRANPVDALDVIGRYVRNLHMKDGLYPVNGHDLGQEVPIGQGKVDFVKLIARLGELGYDGPLTIEREITGPQQTADIRAAKKYLEAILNA